MTGNPFKLLGKKEKLTIDYIIEDLDNEDLINYFQDLIYRSFSKATVKNDLKNSVDTIIESLREELKLISFNKKTKNECFKEYYNDLYNLLDIF